MKYLSWRYSTTGLKGGDNYPHNFSKAALMAKLYLVRHGEAAAGWSDDRDPGLSALGRKQAEAVAAALARERAGLILTSPLKRCRETAQPLAAACALAPVIDHAVAEIPSPVDDFRKRGLWLQRLFQGDWRDADEKLLAWRSGVLRTFSAQTRDAVIFTHFVAINVAVGRATRDDRVLCFHPDNFAVTEFTVDNGALALIKRGREAVTKLG